MLTIPIRSNHSKHTFRKYVVTAAASDNCQSARGARSYSGGWTSVAALRAAAVLRQLGDQSMNDCRGRRINLIDRPAMLVRTQADPAIGLLKPNSRCPVPTHGRTAWLSPHRLRPTPPPWRRTAGVCCIVECVSQLRRAGAAARGRRCAGADDARRSFLQGVQPRPAPPCPPPQADIGPRSGRP